MINWKKLILVQLLNTVHLTVHPLRCVRRVEICLIVGQKLVSQTYPKEGTVCNKILIIRVMRKKKKRYKSIY